MSAPSSLVFFCDGSARNNGKLNAKAGYAIYFPNHSEHTKASLVPSHMPQTNNCAEYMACLEGLKACNEIDPSKLFPVTVYTDSQLLIKSMTQWIKNWKKNGWKTASNDPVANMSLLQQLDNIISERGQVTFIHVEAHTGRTDWISKSNDIVDRMARDITAPRKSHCILDLLEVKDGKYIV